MLILLLCLPGCGGCRQAPEKPKTPEELEKEQLERKKREEEAKKPPFQAKFVVSRPPTGTLAELLWYKPGHWTCVSVEDVKANHFDLLGELELTPIDNSLNPLQLRASPFRLSVRRDVALSKGQTKSLESLLLVPPAAPSAAISYRLCEGHSGRSVLESSHTMKRMYSYQYHLVVFARLPESYGYLDRLHTICPPGDLDNRVEPVYQVAKLKGERRPALPTHTNQWTSIAAMLWDDALPTALEPAQQQAMLDWLHWGGQLIVSGPDTLDSLRDSFLGPYLPALSAGARKVEAADLDELNAFSGKAIRPLRPVRAWSGVRLKVHRQAQFVPGSGELLVERRVGRGRIVASAFRLSNPELIDWPGCDEFFNAMLLRRPPRKYVEGNSGDPLLQWADGGPRLDAARTTGLRYFSRDTSVPFTEYATDVAAIRNAPNDEGDPGLLSTMGPTETAPWTPPPGGPGLAAWNDFNPVAQAARTALTAAARVEVPNRSFVLWVITAYVIVLVPVNWAVFRALGRVEWAWAAAPVIALICTGTVIRLAQLDIGFIRSQTEVAVAELQADYGRAHLTRYNALYTSLATSYVFRCDDPGGVMLPLPTKSRPDEFRMSMGQQVRSLTYRRDESPSLTGFHVGSNTTGLMHSEEMFDPGGGISLAEGPGETCRLLNRTGWKLQGAGLMRLAADGQLQTAWLGTVPPAKSASGPKGRGTSVPSNVPSETNVTWTSLGADDAAKPLWAHERDGSPLTESRPSPGALNLRGVMELGQNPKELQPGEVRLVAWSDDDLPGLGIEPAAPQARRGIVVIAHLAYGFGEDPRPDKNTRGAPEQKALYEEK